MKADAKELKALGNVTKGLQTETWRNLGQTHSLVQENSAASLKTTTDLGNVEVETKVEELSEEENSRNKVVDVPVVMQRHKNP